MLIAYLLIEGRKVTVCKVPGDNKEKLREELINDGIDFDGIDRIWNYEKL